MKEHLKAKFPNIKDVDYALLPNAEEAKMEATDFFNVQWTAFNAGTGITKDKIIAAGIGSSSTQVYTMVNNEVVAIGDSTLGALPATGVVKDTMAKFGPKWGKLFPKSFEPEGKTFVAMNAVGYSVQNCYEAATKLASPAASGDECEKATGTQDSLCAVKKAVKAHKTITADALLKFAEECENAAKDDFAVYYPGALLKGLAENLRDSKIPNVLLECTFDKKCGIPGGASWATYVISQNFPGAKADGKFHGKDDETVDCDKCGDLKHVTERPKCANWCAKKRNEDKVAGAKKKGMDEMNESMKTRRN